MAKIETQIPAKRLIHKAGNKTPVNKDSLEGMTKETDYMVHGEFVNVECPGQPAKICGKYYKDMEFFSYTFKDGEKCNIPFSVARFINERCSHFKHSYLCDAQGIPIKEDKATPRYKFIVEGRAS